MEDSVSRIKMCSEQSRRLHPSWVVNCFDYDSSIHELEFVISWMEFSLTIMLHIAETNRLRSSCLICQIDWSVLKISADIMYIHLSTNVRLIYLHLLWYFSVHNVVWWIKLSIYQFHESTVIHILAMSEMASSQRQCRLNTYVINWPVCSHYSFVLCDSF